VNELHSSCTNEASISPFVIARMGLVSASYWIVDNEWVWYCGTCAEDGFLKCVHAVGVGE